VTDERVRARRSDFGAMLVLVYGFFALAAGARSLYQLATELGDAPVPILLSTVAAGVYLVACSQIGRSTPRAYRITLAVCLFELTGVLTVGTLSLVQDDWFPVATVWSDFGVGYGFLPLILPIAGLLWLTRPATRRRFGLDEPTGPAPAATA
jgi:hypothetical protein